MLDLLPRELISLIISMLNVKLEILLINKSFYDLANLTWRKRRTWDNLKYHIYKEDIDKIDEFLKSDMLYKKLKNVYYKIEPVLIKLDKKQIAVYIKNALIKRQENMKSLQSAFQRVKIDIGSVKSQ